MVVATHVLVPGKYLPPVLKELPPLSPPQIIIAVAGPHCRVILIGPSGALVVLVAVQLFVPWIVSATSVRGTASLMTPPQTII